MLYPCKVQRRDHDGESPDWIDTVYFGWWTDEEAWNNDGPAIERDTPSEAACRAVALAIPLEGAGYGIRKGCGEARAVVRDGGVERFYEATLSVEIAEMQAAGVAQ